MPKRKTADAPIETARPVAEPKKRATSTATHKLTTTKKAAQPSHVTGKAAPVIPAVSEPVSSPVSEPVAELISATPEVAQPKVNAAPTHFEIAHLAYLYFEQRGYQAGDPQEDWFRAERELMKLA
ncbi:MAG: DUF2934 domain-containing protein [Bryobacteraceae bacterium]|nr:DUF2934 domain-containing protein [Bryobacteraceae bacterium]